MWGNILGWSISAVLAGLMALFLYSIAGPPPVSGQINSPVFNVAKTTIALPVAPDTVVTPGTSAEDAGELYRKVIAEVGKDRRPYENFNTGGYLNSKDKEHPLSLVEREKRLAAIEFILKARDCQGCDSLKGIFRRDSTLLINYNNGHRELDDLSLAGKDCIKLGLFYLPNNGKPHSQAEMAKALSFWEAAFQLGAHLYSERLTAKELEAGHILMSDAAGALKRYYTEKPDAAQVDKIRAFLDQEGAYNKKLLDAYHVLQALDESRPAGPANIELGSYAGDIFALATNPNADPMFRVEAVLHVGRYRYNATQKGDQTFAPRLLKSMADDPNLPTKWPSVKTAVDAAQNLTDDDFRKLGGDI